MDRKGDLKWNSVKKSPSLSLVSKAQLNYSFFYKKQAVFAFFCKSSLMGGMLATLSNWAKAQFFERSFLLYPELKLGAILLPRLLSRGIEIPLHLTGTLVPKD